MKLKYLHPDAYPVEMLTEYVLLDSLSASGSDFGDPLIVNDDIFNTI